MSPLNQIVNLINNLALSLLAFMLHSTRIVFLFLLLWAFKEGLLTLVPRVFRLMIRILLLPGDLLHSLAHVVAARFLGYTVDVRLAISTGSAERSLLISSGDHIKTRHAMFIALYPLILNGAVLMMLGFSSEFFLTIEKFDVFLIQLPGSLLYAWLFVSIFFYLPPDLGDWMFIYHVLIDRYPYVVYGYLWGGIVWILGSVWIGYIPTTLIISIYLVVVYYTLGRETVERLDVRDPAKKLLEEQGLPPDLVDVLIYDNSQGTS